jgi:hypothetical protein
MAFLNASTPYRVANFCHQGLHHGRAGRQAHSLAVHLGEQRLPLNVDEIHLTKVQDGLAAARGRAGCVPALPQFTHPWAGQLPLEIKAQFIRAIVERDLKHG